MSEIPEMTTYYVYGGEMLTTADGFDPAKDDEGLYVCVVTRADAEAALDRQARDFAAAGVSVVEANDPDHEPCAGTGRLVRAWPPGDVGDPCHCVRWELRLDPASALARDLLDRQAREIVEDARAEAAGDVSPPIAYALRWFASRVEQRFAPKEADPR